MGYKIFIDGHVGTTGLRIRDWLAEREDLELLALPDNLRKDSAARKDAILSSDVSILCLPDDAAKEVADWVQKTETRIIDASSAHRVAPGWVYGLPELQHDQRERIKNARLVSNPGCYSSSSILLLRPLQDNGIISPDNLIFIHALSGYSGGGRNLIETWESDFQGLPYEAPYAYGRKHKHIPELQRYSGMVNEPQFTPAVGAFKCGMRVQIPLHRMALGGVFAEQIQDVYAQRYDAEYFIKLHDLHSSEPYDETTFDPRVCNETNRIELRVISHQDGHVVLVAILDNLGKGASGMAIQSLNLMLGVAEETGLPV